MCTSILVGRAIYESVCSRPWVSAKMYLAFLARGAVTVDLDMVPRNARGGRNPPVLACGMDDVRHTVAFAFRDRLENGMHALLDSTCSSSCSTSFEVLSQ